MISRVSRPRKAMLQDLGDVFQFERSIATIPSENAQGRLITWVLMKVSKGNLSLKRSLLRKGR